MESICGHDLNTKLRLLFLLHRSPYWVTSEQGNESKWNILGGMLPFNNIESCKKDSNNSISCDTSIDSYHICSKSDFDTVEIGTDIIAEESIEQHHTADNENDEFSKSHVSGYTLEIAHEIPIVIPDPLGFISNKYSSKDISEQISLNYNQFQCLTEVRDHSRTFKVSTVHFVC